jgi:lipase
VRLNVYEWGEPGATAVVCLHGVTSYGGRFDWLSDPGRHVVAPDLIGHGRSPWEPPWDVDAHLAAILESVPDSPAVWVGHSFGGRLAAELERGDVSYATVEDAVQARYDSGRVLLAPMARVVASDAPHLEGGSDGRLRYRYCKSAVIAAWSIMASPPPPPTEVPTLIVRGADSWLTLDDHVETYRGALGDLVEVVTVPGGHTVYWDALDETAEAVGAFLAK